jgi:hypothetical protein
MDKFQEEQIKELKHVFHQAAKIIPYSSLGLQGHLNEYAANKGKTPERLAILTSVMIPQLIAMTKTSIDQMFVCFDVMKYIEFFGKDVSIDGKGLEAEKVAATYIRESFSEMVNADSAAAKKLANEHIGNINAAKGAFPKIVNAARNSRKALIEQFSRLDEVLEGSAYFKKRQQDGRPFFDADQKPYVKWNSPTLSFALLQQETIDSMEKMITQSIDYATTLLVKTQLIQNGIIPTQTALKNEWFQVTYDDYLKVQGLIGRIEVLSETREKRMEAINLKLA